MGRTRGIYELFTAEVLEKKRNLKDQNGKQCTREFFDEEVNGGPDSLILDNIITERQHTERMERGEGGDWEHFFGGKGSADNSRFRKDSSSQRIETLR